MKCETALHAHVQWNSATAIWVRTQMSFGVAKHLLAYCVFETRFQAQLGVETCMANLRLRPLTM
jgi:hypothetical protein